jgi:arabinose-5-phosphate isomerase
MNMARQQMNEIETRELTEFASEVMRLESEAINRAARLLDDQFHEAVSILSNCQGSVIVSGVGKSGLIGQKLSATLASTGTISHYMHATEAMHGDLGRVWRSDVALLLSNSGNTEEVVSLAALLAQDSVPIVSITCHRKSRLATLSNAALSIGNVKEACPHNLAPTASTAAMLALGDALALTVSRNRSFSAADFHKRHPGGSLGKMLLPVKDILRFRVGKNTAMVSRETIVREMLLQAEQFPRRCGAVLIVDSDGRLEGILTDGDIRRLIIREGSEVLQRPIHEVMTQNPLHVHEGNLVREVLQVVYQTQVDELPVLDESGRPIGVLDVQDLVALKILID